MSPSRPSHTTLAPALLAGVLAGVLAACEAGTGPGSPQLQLERFAPPPAYAVWWAETEACSGLDGELERVRFYEVTAPVSGGGTRFPCGGEDGALCSGVWQSPHDIYLAPALLGSERLVKHEMLHDLVRVPGHPPVFDACGLLLGSGGAGAERPAIGRAGPPRLEPPGPP